MPRFEPLTSEELSAYDITLGRVAKALQSLCFCDAHEAIDDMARELRDAESVTGETTIRELMQPENRPIEEFCATLTRLGFLNVRSVIFSNPKTFAQMLWSPSLVESAKIMCDLLGEKTVIARERRQAWLARLRIALGYQELRVKSQALRKPAKQG